MSPPPKSNKGGARSLTRWVIWIGALFRCLAYPFLIFMSLRVVAAVARAKPTEFWSAQSYGGVMLAAALSGLALALVRLGDGRFETEKGKTIRRNARGAAGFWLASFIALGAAIFLVSVLERLPKEIETPWIKAPSSGTQECSAPPGCLADGKAAGNQPKHSDNKVGGDHRD